MVSVPLIIGSVVALVAVYFQAGLYNVVYVFGGILVRDIQPISDFPYECRRVRHQLLESCEHMWLDEEERKIYGACKDLDARLGWNPNVAHLDASKRTLTDRIVVLDIDNPGSDGLYGVHALAPVGSYRNAEGLMSNLDVLAFDVEILEDSTRRFYITNHRVPADDQGRPLDPKKVGANSTFEVFDLPKGGSELKHVRTIANPDVLITPNSLALTGDGGFFFTNDHGTKFGTLFELEAIVGKGSVAYCSTTSDECNIVAKGGLFFPNGIVKGRDGLIYVAHCGAGKISVFNPQPDNSLVKIRDIYIGAPVDNLSVDANGDIFAAVFPHIQKMLAAVSGPVLSDAPAAVWRIRKIGGDYEAVKVVEDNEGLVLPITTVAISDASTGRIFISGIGSRFITVCEPK